MQTQQKSHLATALHYLWRGIKAIGGIIPWCLATVGVGFVTSLLVLLVSFLIAPDIQKDTAKTVLKWGFWAPVVLSTVVTAYLAWITDPEGDGDGDEASPQR